MKIIQYTTMLDEDKKNILVKENSGYYPDIKKVDSPDKVVKLLNDVFHAGQLAEEHVFLIGMDKKANVIGTFVVSHGGADYSVIEPRSIFVRLCLCGATRFVIAHNHPSGDPTPSGSDIDVTRRVKECGNLMGIPMDDHLIVSASNYYSFAESNLL